MYIMRKLTLLLFALLASHSTVVVSSGGAIGPLDEEILGLITFKSSLIDPNHALSTWTPNDDTPCWWSHVQCDAATSHVVSLSLDSLSLSGPPLFRGLDRLQSLESLSLSNNRLSGPLPPGLSLLSHLKVLDLSRNSLSGRLPEDLGSISSLTSLELSDNILSGPIPASLFATCSSLRYLSLGVNRLEGKIPSTLLNCRFLLNLNLSNNRLSGSPDFVSLSRLRVLDISSNSLSGSVSDGLANLHNLKSLNLSNNEFSGPIPIGIARCSHLNSIDLSRNNFTGAIPSGMESLSSLSFFSLSRNKLSGDLPKWIGNLGFLKYLDLAGNKLTGEIPELKYLELNYLSLSDNLITGIIPRNLFDLGLNVLDLSSNKLVGSVPLGSRNVSRTVQSLDLSNNRLTGVIPAGIGYFKNMSVLDLGRNEFSGRIPGEICDSGSLSVLQLDGNSLSGSIPKEIGNCSSLYLLSLSHNSLTGPIPVAISSLKKLEVLKLEFNSLNGEIPQQLGTLNNLLAVNISHNRLTGRLPDGGIFASLDRSALQGNPGLCSPLLTQSCQMNVPKPLVLDPNEINNQNASSVTVPGPAKSNHRRFFGVSTIVAISVAIVVALGVVLVSLLNVSARRRRSRGILDNALESVCSSSTKSRTLAVGKTVLFGSRSNLRMEDLVSAESLLSKVVEIGRGAFGTMYKSSIGEGRVVAIKKLLTSNIIRSHEAFDREIRTLAKARHPNLMPIKGYHWTPQLQMLISEFAPNGSLQARLHESEETFPWPARFNVALGTANGLAYLHQSFRPPIIHYNITPSNILLDENCNPNVSDFGLARLLPKLGRFQSAMGYVAPELASQSLGVNEKCDVYAFGVIVLEMVTGRKPVEYGEDDVMILIDTVRAMLEAGNLMDCVDSRMGEFPVEEVMPVLKLGILCTSQVPSSRPTMAEVVQILQVIKIPTVDEGMGAF